MQLGFIGLGVIGLPMAGHLRAAGHTLFAHSCSGVAATLTEARPTSCATAADVAAAADIAFRMPPDAPPVSDALFRESGVTSM